MKHLKKYTMIGIFFVLAKGTLDHFLYDWSGQNYVVGLLTPINESVWEHMKMLFYPMLLYTLYLIYKFKRTYSCITSSLCFGILMGTILIPVFFYAYTSILGKDTFIFDIGIFILSILIAFWLSYKLTLSRRLEPYTVLLSCLVIVLLICFMVFTYHPLGTRIFQDQTASQSA